MYSDYKAKWQVSFLIVHIPVRGISVQKSSIYILTSGGKPHITLKNMMQAKTHRCPLISCVVRRHNLLLRSNHVASARCWCISCGRLCRRRGGPNTTESGYTLFWAYTVHTHVYVALQHTYSRKAHSHHWGEEVFAQAGGSGGRAADYFCAQKIQVTHVSRNFSFPGDSATQSIGWGPKVRTGSNFRPCATCESCLVVLDFYTHTQT